MGSRGCWKNDSFSTASGTPKGVPLPPVTRKYVVTSHNLPCPVLDIPTNFHQDIDNHLKGGYSYLIINTLQVIIAKQR